MIYIYIYILYILYYIILHFIRFIFIFTVIFIFKLYYIICIIQYYTILYYIILYYFIIYIVYAVGVNGSYGYNIFQNSLNIMHNTIFWSTTCQDTLHQVPAPPNGMRPSRYPWPRVASACACGRWLQGVAPPRDPPYAPDICKRFGIFGSELWGSTEDLPKYLPKYLSESHSRSGSWISPLFHAVLCLATDQSIGLPSGDWIGKETHGETHGFQPRSSGRPLATYVKRSSLQRHVETWTSRRNWTARLCV